MTHDLITIGEIVLAIGVIFSIGFWMPYLVMVALAPLFVAQWLAAKTVGLAARAVERGDPDERSRQQVARAARHRDKIDRKARERGQITATPAVLESLKPCTRACTERGTSGRNSAVTQRH